MIFKMLPAVEGEQQIYARIDDDGKCRLTCTADHPEFVAWLAEGNLPIPVESTEGSANPDPIPAEEPTK
jgi:hypothetical protein